LKQLKEESSTSLLSKVKEKTFSLEYFKQNSYGYFELTGMKNINVTKKVMKGDCLEYILFI